MQGKKQNDKDCDEGLSMGLVDTARLCMAVRNWTHTQTHVWGMSGGEKGMVARDRMHIHKAHERKPSKITQGCCWVCMYMCVETEPKE